MTVLSWWCLAVLDYTLEFLAEVTKLPRFLPWDVDTMTIQSNKIKL